MNSAKTTRMPTLSVVYFSATGTTAMLVDAICAGAQELVSTRAYRVLGIDIVDGCFRNEDALALVDRADAVVFGSPTTTGGPAAQYKAFADASGTDEARVAEKTSSRPSSRREHARTETRATPSATSPCSPHRTA